MSQVLTCLLCRPSASGSLIILGDYTLNGGASNGNVQPAISDIRQVILQRGRLHFTNKDSVNLAHFVCHFSVVAENPCTLVYACVAEAGLAQCKAAVFLDLLQGAIMNDAALLARLADSGDYQLQQQIGPKFAELMMEQNKENAQSTRMSQLQQQVNDVKTVMNSNVQRILERGDRLENLEGRTEALTQSSESFKVSARRVHRQLCRKNAKWTIIIIIGSVVVVIIIILIILNSVGVFDHK
ncbi:Vesicle-associated membrane protein 7 [Toxocara canis]|uniref:Vesicle-associated membrane protein 7 n=1 Tax=Toxocara canis TaxID=6265 RepID=A0A0B2UUE5_TOXCA|nr:Vesicle-associated membrane protein 7 [Toxocara canis]